MARVELEARVADMGRLPLHGGGPDVRGATWGRCRSPWTTLPGSPGEVASQVTLQGRGPDPPPTGPSPPSPEGASPPWVYRDLTVGLEAAGDLARQAPPGCWSWSSPSAPGSAPPPSEWTPGSVTFLVGAGGGAPSPSPGQHHQNQWGGTLEGPGRPESPTPQGEPAGWLTASL